MQKRFQFGRGRGWGYQRGDQGFERRAFQRPSRHIVAADQFRCEIVEPGPQDRGRLSIDRGQMDHRHAAPHGVVDDVGRAALAARAVAVPQRDQYVGLRHGGATSEQIAVDRY